MYTTTTSPMYETTSSSSSLNISSDGMTSSNSMQLGGKGYNHKKGCKCFLCKKSKRKYRKGGEMNTDNQMITHQDSVEDDGMVIMEEDEIPKFESNTAALVGGKTRKKRGSRKSRKVNKRKTRKGKKKYSSRRKSRKH